MNRTNLFMLVVCITLLSTFTALAGGSSSALGYGYTVEVPLEGQSGALWVDVRLNQRVTCRMQIDTGASVVVLPRAMAESLGLAGSGQTLQLQTIHGLAEGRRVTLDHMKVGNAVVENVSAVVLDTDDARAVPLLGRSFLNNFSFGVDLDRNIFTLTPRRSGSPVAWQSARPEDYIQQQIAVLRSERERALREGRGNPRYIQRLDESLAQWVARLEAID